MATRDAAAGTARQEFAIGRMGKCVIDLKNTNCTHTPSLTPPCAAKLNNDVVVVGEKHHNLYPAIRERGEREFNCFSSWYPPIFFPTSLPGEVKPSSAQRSGVQKRRPRLCLCRDIPQISPPFWTALTSPLQNGEGDSKLLQNLHCFHTGSLRCWRRHQDTPHKRQQQQSLLPARRQPPNPKSSAHASAAGSDVLPSRT